MNKHQTPVIKNFSFGVYTSIEEAKPLIHGFFVPLVVMFLLTSLSAAVAYTAAAYFVTRVKRGKYVARELALWGAIIPLVSSFFFGMGLFAKYIS